MPQATPAFDAEQTAAAAARFGARTPEREKNLAAQANGDPTAGEPPARVALRVNRLLAHVDQANPGGSPAGLPPVLAAEVSHAPIRASFFDSELLERVIVSLRDFLFVEFLEQGQGAARAVGRLTTRLGNGQVAYGTGFMVSPGLLLTNHHVLPDAEAAGSTILDMDYARDGASQTRQMQSFALQPDRFFLTDAGFDMALVAVDHVARQGAALSLYGWLPLIADEGKIITGDLVNIVQHPLGQLKQVVVRNGKLVDLPQGDATKYAYYIADTQPGASGSPVFNDQWEVVALHHSAIPDMDTNGNWLTSSHQIWDKVDPAEVKWVANEGVRISRLLAFLQTAQAQSAIQGSEPGLLAAVLTRGQPVALDTRPEVSSKPNAADRGGAPAIRTPVADPPSPAPPPEPAMPAKDPQLQSAVGSEAPSPEPPSPSQPAPPPSDTPAERDAAPIQITLPAAGGMATVRLDVRVSVEGASTPNGPGFLETPPGPETQERAVVVDTLSKGFDPSFLGFPAALPALDPAARAVATPLADGGVELKYCHYSVIFNGARKVALVSAVNLDPTAKAKARRDGPDVWSYDPRVDRALQAGAALYSGNPLDKGHLTRREDAAWGADEAEAKRGNDDTFVWTNCSAQHEIFNRSSEADIRGLHLWGGLENQVTAQAKISGRRASIFNGPVLRPDDREYRGVKLPRQFWKIVVVAKDSKAPGAYAFLLSQEDLLSSLPQEDFSPGPFKTWQVPLSQIRSLTGLDFSALSAGDPLAGAVASPQESARAGARALSDLTDILL